MPLPPYDSPLASCLLDVIEHDGLPLTERGVSAVCGVALVSNPAPFTLLAATDDETSRPLRHGGRHLIEHCHSLPASTRPDHTTHGPCSRCLSAISWIGFSHEDTRVAVAIPHGLKEVLDVEPGGYRRRNAFWDSLRITDMIESLAGASRAAPQARVDGPRARHGELSAGHRSGKLDNAIPLR